MAVSGLLDLKFSPVMRPSVLIRERLLIEHFQLERLRELRRLDILRRAAQASAAPELYNSMQPAIMSDFMEYVSWSLGVDNEDTFTSLKHLWEDEFGIKVGSEEYVALEKMYTMAARELMDQKKKKQDAEK